MPDLILDSVTWRYGVDLDNAPTGQWSVQFVEQSGHIPTENTLSGAAPTDTITIRKVIDGHQRIIVDKGIIDRYESEETPDGVVGTLVGRDPKAKLLDAFPNTPTTYQGLFLTSEGGYNNIRLHYPSSFRDVASSIASRAGFTLVPGGYNYKLGQDFVHDTDMSYMDALSSLAEPLRQATWGRLDFVLDGNTLSMQERTLGTPIAVPFEQISGRRHFKSQKLTVNDVQVLGTSYQTYVPDDEDRPPTEDLPPGARIGVTVCFPPGTVLPGYIHKGVQLLPGAVDENNNQIRPAGYKLVSRECFGPGTSFPGGVQLPKVEEDEDEDITPPIVPPDETTGFRTAGVTIGWPSPQGAPYQESTIRKMRDVFSGALLWELVETKFFNAKGQHIRTTNRKTHYNAVISGRYPPNIVYKRNRTEDLTETLLYEGPNGEFTKSIKEKYVSESTIVPAFTDDDKTKTTSLRSGYGKLVYINQKTLHEETTYFYRMVGQNTFGLAPQQTQLALSLMILYEVDERKLESDEMEIAKLPPFLDPAPLSLRREERNEYIPTNSGILWRSQHIVEYNDDGTMQETTASDVAGGRMDSPEDGYNKIELEFIILTRDYTYPAGTYFPKGAFHGPLLGGGRILAPGTILNVPVTLRKGTYFPAGGEPVLPPGTDTDPPGGPSTGTKPKEKGPGGDPDERDERTGTPGQTLQYDTIFPAGTSFPGGVISPEGSLILAPGGIITVDTEYKVGTVLPGGYILPRGAPDGEGGKPIPQGWRPEPVQIKAGPDNANVKVSLPLLGTVDDCEYVRQQILRWYQAWEHEVEFDMIPNLNVRPGKTIQITGAPARWQINTIYVTSTELQNDADQFTMRVRGFAWN